MKARIDLFFLKLIIYLNSEICNLLTNWNFIDSFLSLFKFVKLEQY